MNRAKVADLGRALRLLGGFGEQLVPATATSEQLVQIREDLRRALVMVADADGEAPTTRCPQHPRGPVEPGTDGECLLCHTRRGRAAKAEAEDVPAEVVAAAIEELGEQQAIALYGGAAVARVLNARHPVRLTKGPAT